LVLNGLDSLILARIDAVRNRFGEMTGRVVEPGEWGDGISNELITSSMILEARVLDEDPYPSWILPEARYYNRAVIIEAEYVGEGEPDL
jgi:hypothetical protein